TWGSRQLVHAASAQCSSRPPAGATTGRTCSTRRREASIRRSPGPSGAEDVYLVGRVAARLAADAERGTVADVQALGPCLLSGDEDRSAGCDPDGELLSQEARVVRPGR